MKKFSGGILLFLVCYLPVSAATVQNTSSPCVWRVGVFEFKAVGSEDTLDNLKYAIPREILAGLSDPLKRYVTLEDKKLLQAAVNRKKLINMEQKLSSLYSQRDLLFLSGEAGSKAQETVIRQITDKKNEIAAFERISKAPCSSSTIDIKVNAQRKTGQLYSLTGGSLESIFLKKDLEEAVYGELEMVDQWLSVSVYLYNYLTKSKEVLYNGLMDPAEIRTVIPGIIIKIKDKTTGRAAPVLLVEGEPSHAFFNLDGGKNFVSGSSYTNFPSGSYLLRVHKNGYQTVKQEITLQDGGKKTAHYILRQQKTGYVSLSTFPAGAEIYSGSLPIGTSPLILQNPVFPLYLTVKKKGFNSKNSIIEHDVPSRTIRFYLVPEEVNTEKLISERRRQFYNSFGLFVVSLSLPVISYGLSSDYGYAFNTLIQTKPFGQEAQRLMDSSTLWYDLYLGGVFVSASLFINLTVDLWNYIKLYN